MPLVPSPPLPIYPNSASKNLVHTKASEGDKKWPICWEKSSFWPLWRFWNTCQVRTLTSATDEMNALNPSGRRQIMATTTFKNDPETLAAAHAAWRDGFASTRRGSGKDVYWTMVLQPLLPRWVCKGDPIPLGLDGGCDEPLVLVYLNASWPESHDEELVKTTTRCVIEQIDAFATAHKTDHRYRFLNYCAQWQRPLEGYGEDNLRFLQETSSKYDPEGLFQKGCVGGFKLDV